MVTHRLSIRRSWVTSVRWSVTVAVWFVSWLWFITIITVSAIFWLGVSTVFWLGICTVFWLGVSTIFWLGVFWLGVFWLGISTIFWLGVSAIFWLGVSAISLLAVSATVSTHSLVTLKAVWTDQLLDN